MRDSFLEYRFDLPIAEFLRGFALQAGDVLLFVNPRRVPDGFSSHVGEGVELLAETEANSLAAKVNNQGYTASVEQALVNGKTYHRVFVRGLASQSAAENLGEELHASLGISYLVRRQP